MSTATPNSLNKGIYFVALDLGSLIIAVFVNFYFGANPDLFSQLEFIISPLDKFGNAIIIHNGSLKSKRVTFSTHALGLFAVVHGFDILSTFRISLNDMLKCAIQIYFCSDSQSLFNRLVRTNQKTEKRLLIDVKMLCQS